MTPTSDSSPVLAEVIRNGLIECEHRGSVVVQSPAGETLVSRGDPARMNYGRSANKMMQAVAMLRLGLNVDQRHLAVVTSSHSGGDEHLAVVLSLLTQYGLDVSDLRNVSAPPLGVSEYASFLRSGRVVSALTMDCSGKHAGMLATCVENGWDRDNYLHVEHPLQQAIAATIDELTREVSAGVGVDGCGAPASLVSLHGLATSLSALAVADSSTFDGRVAAAIRQYPTLVGGRGRDVTEFLLAAPGWIGKDGADGGMVLASPEGFSVAVRIADGAARPRIPVAIAALRAAGVALPELPLTLERPAVFGGGSVVGELRPT